MPSAGKCRLVLVKQGLASPRSCDICGLGPCTLEHVGPIHEEDTNPYPRLKEARLAVGRELGLRRNVYPKWVKAGRMSQAKADEEIAAMEAAYNILSRLE